jgi:putative membrane protein
MRNRQRLGMEQLVTGLAAAAGTAAVVMGIRALARRLAIRRHRGRATTADAAFIMAAVDDHVRTITLGEVAGVRADHVEVRDFAQLLAEHHTQALTDLSELAGYLGVGIATEPSGRLRRRADRLRAGTGIRVDRDFIGEILDHHRLTVRLFDEAVQSAESPEVRAYARAQLPHLQAHLRVAEDLARHLDAVAAS